MIDPMHVPQIDQSETLARYVLHRSHIRPSNGTVKPDAFIPHPHQDLSVTRHLSTTAEELWSIGESIARATRKVLRGRADIRAVICAAQGLVVRAAPVAGNPNHANVSEWPADKPAQKIIAQEIAAAAVLVSIS